MSPATGFLAATALLAALNVGGSWAPGWTYVPANLAALAALLLISHRSGAGRADLGSERGNLRRGSIVGLVAGAGFAAVIGLLAAIPATRGLFDDQRAADIGTAGLLYQTVVRIPLGTALFEEAAFRGVLTGLARLAWGTRVGTLVPALLFGLWHVVPALRVADGNATAEGWAAGVVVAGSVVATFAAGLVFTLLRDRTKSLAAPMVVHALVNVAAFTAAWVVV